MTHDLQPQPLVEKLQTTIDSGAIVDAKQADEAVCRLLGESGLAMDSAEYEALSARLCDIAGKAFPGDWEDYPVQVDDAQAG